MNISSTKTAKIMEMLSTTTCKTLLVLGILFFSITVLYLNQESVITLNLFSNSTPQPNEFTTTTTGTNTSHIVFILSGTAQAWSKRGPFVESWWRPNETRGHIWMDKSPDLQPWPKTAPPVKVSGDIKQFKAYDHHGHPAAIRQARMLLEAFDLGLPDVRWFIIADDDTILFVDNIVEMLNKYDHNGYHYIGGGSEVVFQNYQHSFSMAFGGAGYAVSYPLAKALSKTLDGCIKRYPYVYGADQLKYSCISELGVSVDRVPGFHQFDLHGDISGFLSAHPQAPLLSFHHVDHLNPIFPSMNHSQSYQHFMKAANVDSSRLLQQTICYDKRNSWSVSVSWGYSVQIFEAVHSPSYLEIPIQTFEPWNEKGHPLDFMFNVRPVTVNDSCLTPHIFYLESVHRKDSNHLVSTYTRSAPRELPPCDHNSADFIYRIEVISPASRFRWDIGRRECSRIVKVHGSSMTIINAGICKANEAMNQVVF